MKFSMNEMKKMKKAEGPSTIYDHFMRVCADKNEEIEIYFRLKILIISLVEHV